MSKKKARHIKASFFMETHVVVFTALLGLAFLGQTPDIYSILGYFIIFGASLYMFVKNKSETA